MIGSSKSKNTVIIVTIALVCVLAVLFFFKDSIIPSKGNESSSESEDIPQSETREALSEDENPSAVTSNGRNTSSSLPEEIQEVNEEWIEVEELPFSVYFRKYTFTLEKCTISKELLGQPKPIYNHYAEETEYNDEGDILSGQSYIHIKFKLKNERNEEITAAVNSHHLFLKPLSEKGQFEIIEASMMNKTENLNERTYYHCQMAAGEEKEFIVTYIVPDECLGDQYEIYYSFQPTGIADYVELEGGKRKMIRDARILLLDNIAVYE